VATDCAIGAAACMAAVNASPANMVMLPLATRRPIGVRGLILLPSTTPKVSAGPVRRTQMASRATVLAGKITRSLNRVNIDQERRMKTFPAYRAGGARATAGGARATAGGVPWPRRMGRPARLRGAATVPGIRNQRWPARRLIRT
jgi:hypothetical protein